MFKSLSRTTRTFALLLGLAILSTSIALPASAQSSRGGTTELGLFLGWKIYSDDNELGYLNQRDSVPDDGMTFGGRVGYNLTDRLGVEAELEYVASTFRDTGAAAGILGWRGSALFHFMTGGFRPFVLAGVGGETLLDSQPGVVEDTDSAFHLGLGAKVDVTRAFALRGDARYINMPGIVDTTSNNWEFTLGASFTLGLAPDDSDGDGLNDAVDRCPTEAEDKDGFEDSDGCPDLDNDADGVADSADSCPDEAEDKDGFEDADGCPDLDNDRDGIADASDKCTDKAEDRDGFEDDDGCPDLDNDRDGIADSADKCPNESGVAAEKGCPVRDRDHDGIADNLDKCPDEAETFNGIKDDDGCPDAKATVIITSKEIKILEKVYFDTGKASIKSVSFTLLDTVATVLMAHPEISLIIIEGHTDDVGKDDANLALSEGRAQSVRTYLIEKGMAEARLEAHGFGETAPVCGNVAELEGNKRKNRKAIAACRDENRRVQFRIGAVNGKRVEPTDSVTIERTETKRP